MDTWRSGLPSSEVGFRAGYEAGFSLAIQGLVVTVPSAWRNQSESDPGRVAGGWWQVGWREGWVAGCEDGRQARKGDERLGN